jgi:indole-3-glycerol phosphate synthase
VTTTVGAGAISVVTEPDFFRAARATSCARFSDIVSRALPA